LLAWFDVRARPQQRPDRQCLVGDFFRVSVLFLPRSFCIDINPLPVWRVILWGGASQQKGEGTVEHRRLCRRWTGRFGARVAARFRVHECPEKCSEKSSTKCDAALEKKEKLAILSSAQKRKSARSFK
jgi:hypothetical protein